MSKASLAAQFDRFDELQAGLNAARVSLIHQINTADIAVDVLSSHALKSGCDVDILRVISNRGVN